MKRSLVPILAAVTALAIGACRWQLPEQVVVRATPEVWIPTGAALFEVDFLGELIELFEDLCADLGFAGGEKEGVDGYDGKPLILYAALQIDTPTFPDLPPGGVTFDAYFEDQTDPIDLSGVFGPFPEQAALVEVPGWVWFVPAGPGAPPEVQVRLRAQWTADGSPNTEYLLGDIDNFVSLASSPATANDFDLGAAFNDRPEDLVLVYEFGADSGELADILSLHLRFEVPFVFTAPGGTLLELEDEEGGNPLAMEEDIFGRDPLDPDEELDGLLESIRGSNATLLLRLTNSSGLGADFGIVNVKANLSEAQRQNPDNWVLRVPVSAADTEQEIRIEITAAVVDQLIEGVGGQFVPEFLVLLPTAFQINRDWKFGITEGYLRARVKLDYQISLEDEA